MRPLTFHADPHARPSPFQHPNGWFNHRLQVKRRSLPSVCARIAYEALHDADTFVLAVADDFAPSPAGAGCSGGVRSRYYGQAVPEEVAESGQEGSESHWFWW